MTPTLVILLAAIIFIGLALLAFMSRQSKPSRLNKAEYQRRWQEIEQLINQGTSAQKLAIIEADKLTDKALQDNGYPGDTMGERLKDARHALKNNDAIWNAHKLRNRLAHEHDVSINKIVLTRALNSFKSALKDLGAL